MPQKFFHGDLVHVKPHPAMRSDPQGCKAIVLHSYAERYSGQYKDTTDLALYLLGNQSGFSAWHDENLLTLIEPNRLDMLPDNDIFRKNHDAKQARDRS
jgi:hypothetical protein